MSVYWYNTGLMERSEVIAFFRDTGTRHTVYQLLVCQLAQAEIDLDELSNHADLLRQAIIGDDEFAHFRHI